MVLVAVCGELAELPSARPWPATRWRADGGTTFPAMARPGGTTTSFRPWFGLRRNLIGLLKDAHHVGHRLAVTRRGPTPADHNPLADVGRSEPDL